MGLKKHAAGARLRISSFRLSPLSFPFVDPPAPLVHSANATAIDRNRTAVNPNMAELTIPMAYKRDFSKYEKSAVEFIRMNSIVAITALATGDMDCSQPSYTDGALPDDGLKSVIEPAHRGAKASREVAASGKTTLPSCAKLKRSWKSKQDDVGNLKI